MHDPRPLLRYARFTVFILSPVFPRRAGLCRQRERTAQRNRQQCRLSPAGVDVSVAGNNSRSTRKPTRRAPFCFPRCALGSYEVTAVSGELRVRARVDLSGGGAAITLDLRPLSEIGHTVVSRARADGHSRCTAAAATSS